MQKNKIKQDRKIKLKLDRSSCLPTQNPSQQGEETGDETFPKNLPHKQNFELVANCFGKLRKLNECEGIECARDREDCETPKTREYFLHMVMFSRGARLCVYIVVLARNRVSVDHLYRQNLSVESLGSPAEPECATQWRESWR